MTTIAQLDAVIEDLTVDAHDDDEQLSGFLVGADEALEHGEPARTVGIDDVDHLTEALRTAALDAPVTAVRDNAPSAFCPRYGPRSQGFASVGTGSPL
ncbi:MAG: hypothetical protein ACR2LK_05725 [Solirubrobacteraceae bacterium]|jgi:hypothetical protein